MKMLIISALAVLGTFYVSAEPVCWDNVAEDQRHCYTLTTSMVPTWNAATCGAGKERAGIESAEEQTFLNENLGSLNPTTDLWFGARYQTFTGDVWRWTTTSNRAVDLVASGITWNNGEPDADDNAALLHNEVGNDYWVFRNDNPTDSKYVLCEADTATPLLTGAEFAVTIDANRHYHGFTTDDEDEMSWTDANARCQGLGARLARVDTDALRLLLQVQLEAVEQQYMNDAADFWIGLHRGEWQWTGGEAIEGDTNWALNQPGSIGCGYLTFVGGNDAQWRAKDDCEYSGAGMYGLCEEVDTDGEPGPGPGNGDNGAPSTHLSLFVHLYIVAVIVMSIFN